MRIYYAEAVDTGSYVGETLRHGAIVFTQNNLCGCSYRPTITGLVPYCITINTILKDGAYSLSKKDVSYMSLPT
jgi:hypothetical protein